MLALMDQTKEPFVASETEATIAKTATERLQPIVDANQDVSITVREMPNVVVPLPARAVAMILHILKAMKDRTPFSIIPYDAELTTQQAADYLNVSRPYLVGLIDKGALKHRVVGRHRRVLFGDLLEFEMGSRKKREAAIARMAAEEERLGLE